MERINVSLPPELRGQLDAASAESGKSVADEIRSRLEWVFRLDGFEPVDNPTLDLLSGIARIAADLVRETGSAWHAHAGTHSALRQAIRSRLERVRPEGDPAFGPRPHRAGAFDDPQQIGMWAEFNDWEHRDFEPAARQRLRQAMEKSWQEIMELQQRREQGGGDE